MSVSRSPPAPGVLPELGLRGLPAPEPLLQAPAAADRLAPGAASPAKPSATTATTLAQMPAGTNRRAGV